MEFGCWCRLEDIPAVKAAGFDYAECPVETLVPEQDYAAFAPVLAQIKAAPLPVRAFNLFVPPDLKIVGPDLDQARIERFVRTAIARVHQAGAGILVFGSGPARAVPEGFPRERAEEQLVGFCQLVADVAESEGVLVVIEPICRGGTNILNTIPEAVELARRINRPSIRVMADVGQMYPDDEPLSNLTECQDWIAHVHLTDADRGAPGTGDVDWPEVMTRLRRADYDGLVSVECRWHDFGTQAPACVCFIRQAWQDAGQPL